MKRVLAASLVLFGLAAPAHATEWLVCGSADGKASFSVLLGSLGIGTATDFKVNVGGKDWSTTPGEGTPIVKSQAFETDAMLMADVSTEDLSTLIAQLRIFKGSEGDDYVYGGILRVPGHGAWAVSCEG